MRAVSPEERRRWDGGTQTKRWRAIAARQVYKLGLKRARWREAQAGPFGRTEAMGRGAAVGQRSSRIAAPWLAFNRVLLSVFFLLYASPPNAYMRSPTVAQTSVLRAERRIVW